MAQRRWSSPPLATQVFPHEKRDRWVVGVTSSSDSLVCSPPWWSRLVVWWQLKYSALRLVQTARRHVGYCPQFDATQATMTGREHLNFYARLRGVSDPARRRCAPVSTPLCTYWRFGRLCPSCTIQHTFEAPLRCFTWNGRKRVGACGVRSVMTATIPLPSLD
eukprot:1186224-Prorocentrum_minimum.AAC.1